MSDKTHVPAVTNSQPAHLPGYWQSRAPTSRLHRFVDAPLHSNQVWPSRIDLVTLIFKIESSFLELGTVLGNGVRGHRVAYTSETRRGTLDRYPLDPKRHSALTNLRACLPYRHLQYLPYQTRIDIVTTPWRTIRRLDRVCKARDIETVSLQGQ